MTKKTPELPQSGGSYTRNKNGGLKQVEKPTKPQPIGKAQIVEPAPEEQSEES